MAALAVPQPGLTPDPELDTTFLLVRHGRSADVVPGTPESEDPPLHEQGVDQAAALAARLGGHRIDSVYASDLRRAVETAALLARERGLEVQSRADLREVDLGEWERGEFRRRAAARDPQFLRFAASGRWDEVPGSEGDDAVRSRMRAALDELVDRHRGQTFAVVCHGGVINAWLAAQYGTDRTWFTEIDNTSITMVRAGPGDRRVVVTVNDVHHLRDVVTGAAAPATIGHRAPAVDG